MYRSNLSQTWSTCIWTAVNNEESHFCFLNKSQFVIFARNSEANDLIIQLYHQGTRLFLVFPLWCFILMLTSHSSILRLDEEGKGQNPHICLFVTKASETSAHLLSWESHWLKLGPIRSPHPTPHMAYAIYCLHSVHTHHGQFECGVLDSLHGTISPFLLMVGEKVDLRVCLVALL